MNTEQPNFDLLVNRMDLNTPLIGLYDAPDPAVFAPIVTPKPGECVFAFYKDWLQGTTLHLNREHFGCGGCGRWMFSIQPRSQEDFLSFLVDGEGLKASRKLMQQWIEASPTYQPSHPHILIGPLKPERWNTLKSVIFFVNPDQLSTLVYGTQYFTAPDDPTPLISPFGSGCMELLPFVDLEIPQAAIGTTDIAMRHYLPADILSVAVTRTMFQQLCELDENSFLNKPFLQKLRKSRGGSLD
jgi:hypothetical protein